MSKATPKNQDNPRADFWTKHPEASGGGIRYASQEEKKAMCDSGEIIVISAVRYNANNLYKGKPQPRWELTIELPAGIETETRYDTNGVDIGSTRILTLGANAQRDIVMEAMQDYIKSDGTSVDAVLAEVMNDEGTPFFVLNPPSVPF